MKHRTFVRHACVSVFTGADAKRERESEREGKARARGAAGTCTFLYVCIDHLPDSYPPANTHVCTVRTNASAAGKRVHVNTHTHTRALTLGTAQLPCASGDGGDNYMSKCAALRIAARVRLRLPLKEPADSSCLSPSCTKSLARIASTFSLPAWGFSNLLSPTQLIDHTPVSSLTLALSLCAPALRPPYSEVTDKIMWRQRRRGEEEKWEGQ